MNAILFIKNLFYSQLKNLDVNFFSSKHCSTFLWPKQINEQSLIRTHRCNFFLKLNKCTCLFIRNSIVTVFGNFSKYESSLKVGLPNFGPFFHLNRYFCSLIRTDASHWPVISRPRHPCHPL